MLLSEKVNQKQTVRVVPDALYAPYILQDIHPSVTTKSKLST